MREVWASEPTRLLHSARLRFERLGDGQLQHHIFPPWRWPGWYRRRRVIEERLSNLRALRRMIEESQREDG